MPATDTQISVLRDGFGWGIGLWLFGYLLGFLFYPFVAVEVIGWYIMPLGLTVTAFVLWKFVKLDDIRTALVIGFVWGLVAVVFDYVFIILLLRPEDGYYKPDVYLYYISAFLLPLVAAVLRRQSRKRS